MIQPVQNTKPYNPVKKAVKTAAVAAAGAGAVLYMAKTGRPSNHWRWQIDEENTAVAHGVTPARIACDGR